MRFILVESMVLVEDIESMKRNCDFEDVDLYSLLKRKRMLEG